MPVRRTRSAKSYAEIPPSEHEFDEVVEQPLVKVAGRRERPPKNAYAVAPVTVSEPKGSPRPSRASGRRRRFVSVEPIEEEFDHSNAKLRGEVSSTDSPAVDDSTDDMLVAGAEAEARVPKKRGRKPKKKLNVKQGSSDDEDDARDSSTDLRGREESLADELDVRGEEKITPDGVLLGGRRFKFDTFKLPRHDTRFYCFSLDVARCLNYRDSSALFQRHPKLRKVNPTYEDRDYLIESGFIQHKNRNRAFGLVTCRSIFKMFGYRVIRKGRAVRDDYYVGDEPEPEYPDDYDDDDSEVDEDRLNTGDNIVDFFDTRRRAALLQANAALTPSQANASGSDSDIGSNFYIRQQLEIADSLYRELRTVQDQLGRFQEYGKNLPQGAAQVSALHHEALLLNKQLNSQREKTTFDVHTGIEHVPQRTQPNGIAVQRLSRDVNGKELKVEYGSPQSDAEGWESLESPHAASEYPLALLPQQYQSTYSLFCQRFSCRRDLPKVRNVRDGVPTNTAKGAVSVSISPALRDTMGSRLENLEQRISFDSKWNTFAKQPKSQTALSAQEHQHPRDAKDIADLASQFPLSVELPLAPSAAFGHSNASYNGGQHSHHRPHAPLAPPYPNPHGVAPANAFSHIGAPTVSDAPNKYPPPFPRGMLMNYTNHFSAMPASHDTATPDMRKMNYPSSNPVYRPDDSANLRKTIKVDDRPLDTRYNYFCGSRNRDGYPCRRPVSNAGEKCLYHKKKESVQSWL